MMKKLAYPLLALLILSLVGIGILLAQRVGDRNEIANLRAEVTLLGEDLGALMAEKSDWEQDKARIGEGLGTVRTLLVKTLVDLEDVSKSIGFPASTATAVPSPMASAAPSSPGPAASAKPSPLPSAPVTGLAATEETETPANSSPAMTSAATKSPAATPPSTPKATSTASPSSTPGK